MLCRSCVGYTYRYTQPIGRYITYLSVSISWLLYRYHHQSVCNISPDGAFTKVTCQERVVHSRILSTLRYSSLKARAKKVTRTSLINNQLKTGTFRERKKFAFPFLNAYICHININKKNLKLQRKVILIKDICQLHNGSSQAIAHSFSSTIITQRAT